MFLKYIFVTLQQNLRAYERKYPEGSLSYEKKLRACETSFNSVNIQLSVESKGFHTKLGFQRLGGGRKMIFLRRSLKSIFLKGS